MKESIRALLRQIVDYAGLFPPASLDLDTVITNYATYRHGDDAWMLGRLIVPVARLAAFEQRAADRQADGDPWLISALSDDPAADAETIRAFNRRQAGRALVDAVEIKATSAAQIVAARDALPNLAVYVELPIADDPRALVEACAEAGLRAKVRTGGVTPGMIPPSDDLVRFLAACDAAGVAWKATAGLHHPIRAEHRLTYADDSPRDTMYGFLNVFLAAALVRTGDHGAARAMLDETDPAALRFDDAAIRWRDHTLPIEEIGQLRARGPIAFGSCSFEEPTADLRALGLI